MSVQIFQEYVIQFTHPEKFENIFGPAKANHARHFISKLSQNRKHLRKYGVTHINHIFFPSYINNNTIVIY
jgi:hypothetical protein